MTTGRNHLTMREAAQELGQSVEWFRTHRERLSREFYMPEPARNLRPMKWLKKPLKAWIAAYMAGSTPDQLKEIVERARRAAVNDNAQLTIFETGNDAPAPDTTITDAQSRMRAKLTTLKGDTE